MIFLIICILETKESSKVSVSNFDSITKALSQVFNEQYYNRKYPRNLFSLFLLTLSRQWQLVVRDKLFSTARIIQAILMGLIFGWIFFGVYFLLYLIFVLID